MAQGAAGRLARQQGDEAVGGAGHGRRPPPVAGRRVVRLPVYALRPARFVPLLVPARPLLGVAAQTRFQSRRPLVHPSQALVHAPGGLARLSRTPPDPFRTLLRCPIPIPHARSSTDFSFRKIGVATPSMGGGQVAILRLHATKYRKMLALYSPCLPRVSGCPAPKGAPRGDDRPELRAAGSSLRARPRARRDGDRASTGGERHDRDSRETGPSHRRGLRTVTFVGAPGDRRVGGGS